MASRVTFTGLIEPPQVRERLARANVLVLPNPASAISSRFTSPLKLFEYMAAGRPIVASDLPALREVLSPDENAVLVTPGSAPAWPPASVVCWTIRPSPAGSRSRALDGPCRTSPGIAGPSGSRRSSTTCRGR